MRVERKEARRVGDGDGSSSSQQQQQHPAPSTSSNSKCWDAMGLRGLSFVRWPLARWGCCRRRSPPRLVASPRFALVATGPSSSPERIHTRLCPVACGLLHIATRQLQVPIVAVVLAAAWPAGGWATEFPSSRPKARPAARVVIATTTALPPAPRQPPFPPNDTHEHRHGTGLMPLRVASGSRILNGHRLARAMRDGERRATPAATQSLQFRRAHAIGGTWRLIGFTLAVAASQQPCSNSDGTYVPPFSSCSAAAAACFSTRGSSSIIVDLPPRTR